MDMTLDRVITVLVSALVAISPFLIARYSKSRREQGADLSQTYVKLLDLTADQLEERINLIGKLDNRIGELTAQGRSQQNEIETMRVELDKREEQIESMSALVAGLQAQINIDAAERGDLRMKLANLDFRYRLLYQYMLAVLEQLRQHKITPIEPPDGLKDDPEILKIIRPLERSSNA